MRKTVVALGAIAALAAGCAEAGDPAAFESRVRDATQAALGDALTGKTVTLSDIKSSPTRVQWNVQAGAERFTCDSDERFSLPACSPAA